MSRARRDPHSWTSVRLPEPDLAETILEFASPLIMRLGPSPSIHDERGALELAISFWNASVRASECWPHPKAKELNALDKRLRGRGATPEDAAVFDLLAERWRAHRFDPRLVVGWSYQPDAFGAQRLACTVGLPDGVRAEVEPPIDKRIAIDGIFLDEVRIPQVGGRTVISFPYSRHRGVVAEDGTVTVYAMMPTALQLFVEGRLTHAGSTPVEVMVSGRVLGPMVLAEVCCAGERSDIAVLVFKPATVSAPPAK